MSNKPSQYRTDAKRVQGLGSAHSGTHHFWVQRMSAIAIAPLSVWFMAKLLTVLTASNAGAVAHWFQSPVNALLMALFSVAMFVHARLGLQVIIEDYVHCETKKIALLMLNSTANLVLGVASLFAIAHLHLTSI